MAVYTKRKQSLSINHPRSGQVDKWNKQANVSEFRHPMHTAAVPKRKGKFASSGLVKYVKKKYVAAIREGGR